jgi:hypothetical protein
MQLTDKLASTLLLLARIAMHGLPFFPAVTHDRNDDSAKRGTYDLYQSEARASATGGKIEWVGSI